MTTLVTGAAGFIGFHMCKKLLALGHRVVGIDNVNGFYDVNLKKARLEQLAGLPDFEFRLVDISELAELQSIFATYSPSHVVNLAAQAGVRHSIQHPFVYAQSNLTGFLNVLECCRHGQVKHLVYASSSSVYGGNKRLPFAVGDNVDHPLSLYAATKKANELMAHSYSSLYGFPTTGLRFFTVYGPWGRPDMVMFLFTRAILAGEPIELFNHGRMQRDFTYVDDIVEAVARLTFQPPAACPDWNGASDPSRSWAPYRLHNVGNSSPVQLMDLVELLERALGKTAQKIFKPMQPADVEAATADVESLVQEVGYRPSTPVETGVQRFVDWYLDYYGR